MKEGYIKKKSVTIPFGYELSEVEGYLKPIASQLAILNKYIKKVKNQEHSLRDAAELISEETKRKLSHVGLSKLIQKRGGRPKGSKSSYHYSKASIRKQLVTREHKKVKKEKERLKIKEKKQ